MHKLTVLNQITLCADGSIGLQLLKQVINDDGTVFFSEPHRSVVDPDMEPGNQMVAVNEHLAEMGYPPLPADMLGHVEKMKTAHRKYAPITARVETFKAQRAAFEATRNAVKS
ncbi:hypothetical protein J1C56_02110 [Aminobacter anthyllidis]|uniref:Uncharacterized protein n=1 Tax=Aminobacter anthyllidis TaxID=1035067 RepID=A0A9X1A6U3_9HYPH|nr:hypothetical protein [Aminobacter anthyllidis]MBT1154379.1 hypothetical protein [Aminobacter anthyllidis]